MNGIEDEVTEKKDLSRPYFPRKPGEVGLYVDVDDAVPEDAHAYGSEQLMRIEMNDMLGEQLTARDLIKVKGELDRRGHFRGIILEEFRRGAILAVIFDSLSDLDDLCKLHETKQLTQLFQAVFADRAMLSALKVRKLVLRVRVWQDELDACREEMTSSDKKRVNIHTRPRDVALLGQVREFQSHQSGRLQELRDAEAHLERHLSEFLLLVKRALPGGVKPANTLKELLTNLTFAAGTAATHNGPGLRPADVAHIKRFQATLDLLRTALTQAEVGIWLPLTLIPARCETEKQSELKRQMKAACTEAQRVLRPAAGLTEARFKEWEGKVTQGEKTYMGVISLVPLGVEKVTDVDQFLDEYVTGFPQS